MIELSKMIEEDDLDKKHADFKNFTLQYSRRRQKPTNKYLPQNLVNWFDKI